MKPKNDLNNTQRKMLDEIYTEQFNTQANKILDGRASEYRKLKITVLKDEKKTTNVKAVLDAADKFRGLVVKHKDEFEKKGLVLKNYYRSDNFDIELDDGYRRELHPTLSSHNEATREIEISLGQVKKEMRAKIYGLNTTYEEVDREIAEILKGINGSSNKGPSRK